MIIYLMQQIKYRLSKLVCAFSGIPWIVTGACSFKRRLPFCLRRFRDQEIQIEHELCFPRCR
jgi:uncharacterized membrane protein YciS (DUF1049 family)